MAEATNDEALYDKGYEGGLNSDMEFDDWFRRNFRYKDRPHISPNSRRVIAEGFQAGRRKRSRPGEIKGTEFDSQTEEKIRVLTNHYIGQLEVPRKDARAIAEEAARRGKLDFWIDSYSLRPETNNG